MVVIVRILFNQRSVFLDSSARGVKKLPVNVPVTLALLLIFTKITEYVDNFTVIEQRTHEVVIKHLQFEIICPTERLSPTLLQTPS